MDAGLLFVQFVNGIQFGFMLFLIACGLTLVFGILDFANLAHGSFFMLGAYFGATAFNATDSFVVAILAAIIGTCLIGLILDRLIFRFFYGEDHLTHFLVTLGLILVIGGSIRAIWGPFAISMPIPSFLDGIVTFPGDTVLPTIGLVITAIAALVAAALFVVIKYTRLGMLIRASAEDRETVMSLGVNVRRLYMTVIGSGAALAGLAGALIAPLSTVEPGMGDRVLILTFVVVVIGGMGSIRGAFVAAMLVGVVDTVGRTSIPSLLLSVTNPSFATAAGPSIASVVVYMMMAVILLTRPQGLLPAGGGR
jgi:branched-chain amino acid transport system permease protein